MTNKIALIYLILKAFLSHAQISNSVQIDFLKPIIYNTKNTISDEFHSIENGNVQLKSFFGYGINYTKEVIPKWKVHLHVGFEQLYQSYFIPYFVYFSSSKTISKQHDFHVQNNNLRLGLQKQVPICNDKLSFKFGTDIVSRTMKSNSLNQIDQNVIQQATSDTVLFDFITFFPATGGNFVMEVMTGLEIKLWRNLRLNLDCIFSSRYKLGFTYDVTAVQAYTFQGENYKFIWSDSKNANEYILQSIRLSSGLKWRF